MIKVNLQNTAVQNMLTGQNTLDSVFIDGNSILFIEKPEYLKQLYRDEIKARAIKVNLKETEKEYRRMLGECENVKMIPVYSGTKLDVTTGDSVEVKQAEFEDYIETEGNKARMVLDILALDADRLERDCQWLQTKGCGINIMTTPGVPLAVEGGTLEEAIAALIEKKAA